MTSRSPRSSLWTPSAPRIGSLLWIASLGLIALLPTLLLWPFRHAGFVADDHFFVTTSPTPSSLLAVLTSSWGFPQDATSGYRPVVILSYALTRAFWTDGPLAYHLTNFLLHGLNAALLALIVARLTAARITTPTLARPVLAGPMLAGLIAGLLFAIHPSTHENVIWISGRTYALASFFALALVAWTVSAPASILASTSASVPARMPVEAPRTRPAWRQHAVGLFLFACVLGSYEPAVVLPAGVFLARLAMTDDPRRRWRDAIAFTLPYVGLLAIYLALRWTYIAPAAADLQATTNKGGGLAMNVAANLWFLVKGLAAVALFSTPAIMAMLGFAALVAAGLAARVSRPLVLGLLALTIIAFLPFVSLGGSTWRFLYLPLTAFLGAVGIGAARLLADRRLLVRALAVLLLLFLSGRSARQYQIRGQEWQHAGEITRSFVEQTVRLAPSPAPGTELHFLDPPVYYQSAYIFITMFHDTIRQGYPPNNALDIVEHRQEPADAVIRQLASRTDGAPALLFAWSPENERLSLVWRSNAAERGTDARTHESAGGMR